MAPKKRRARGSEEPTADRQDRGGGAHAPPPLSSAARRGGCCLPFCSVLATLTLAGLGVLFWPTSCDARLAAFLGRGGRGGGDADSPLENPLLAGGWDDYRTFLAEEVLKRTSNRTAPFKLRSWNRNPTKTAQTSLKTSTSLPQSERTRARARARARSKREKRRV